MDPRSLVSYIRSVVIFAALLTLAVAGLACGGDDDDDSGAANDSSTPTATTADDDGDDSADDPGEDSGSNEAGGESAGTITINGETWTVVPDIQCSVFPGPVVYIAGYAAEDDSIEITIDYDPDGDLIGARVQADDDDPYWSADEDNVDMELDGDTLTGSGTFSNFVTGTTADGSFEVTC